MQEDDLIKKEREINNTQNFTESHGKESSKPENKGNDLDNLIIDDSNEKGDFKDIQSSMIG
ncbi:hypothetical protein [Mycoplasma sp. 327]